MKRKINQIHIMILSRQDIRIIIRIQRMAFITFMRIRIEEEMVV